MSTSTTERELLQLEKQYWQALKDRDAETALRLTDFPCIITGAQGIGAIEQRAFAAMVQDPPYTIDSVDVEDYAQVRMLTDDVAVLAYKVHEELTVDGRPVSLDAADSSTWVRRNGRWLCALHTEALVGDPFGRDRTRSATGKDEPRGMSEDERTIRQMIARRMQAKRGAGTPPQNAEATALIDEVSVRGEWAWSRTRLDAWIALPHATSLQRTDYTLAIWHKLPDGSWLLAHDEDLLEKP